MIKWILFAVILTSIILNRIFSYIDKKEKMKKYKIQNEKISRIKINSKWNCYKQNDPFNDTYYAIIIDMKKNSDGIMWVKYNYYIDNTQNSISNKKTYTKSCVDFISHFPFEDLNFNNKEI